MHMPTEAEAVEPLHIWNENGPRSVCRRRLARRRACRTTIMADEDDK